LVVGGSGYLGGALVAHAQRAGHEAAATFFGQPGDNGGVTWHQLDIRDRVAVAECVAALEPEVVINAAYRKSDWATSADGAANVALGAQHVGAYLLHVSSDVVFSGRANPYPETALPDPISAYGAAKAAAETAVRAVARGAAIVRTSLILGDGRSPFEALVGDLAGGGRGVLFRDEVLCPVHIADLSAALIEIAYAGDGGVFHVAGPDAITRYDLGCLVAARDGLDVGRLMPGRRGDLDDPGPIDLRLDCRRTRTRLRTAMRGATEFLAASPPSSAS
jgi:dTDP-4-dehydrorhamnose reductase